MQLSFLNANWYRQYPFRSDINLTDNNGNTPSNDIMVGCRLMVDIANYPSYLLGITKLYYNQGFVAVELSSNTGVLGVAKGQITQSNQSLPISSLVPTFSGSVVIGNPDSVQDQACFVYSVTSGALEPSTITVYPPPTITGVVHNGRITGQVTFAPTNLTISSSGQTITFTVIAPTDVASRVDKTARLLTCANPIISGINTVKPFPTTNGNNIDIYGIDPVTISTGSGGVVTVGTTKTVAEVCKPQTIPPTDDSNAYPFDITTTETTEWKTWPQFS